MMDYNMHIYGLKNQNKICVTKCFSYAVMHLKFQQKGTLYSLCLLKQGIMNCARYSFMSLIVFMIASTTRPPPILLSREQCMWEKKNLQKFILHLILHLK